MRSLRQTGGNAVSGRFHALTGRDCLSALLVLAVLVAAPWRTTAASAPSVTLKCVDMVANPYGPQAVDSISLWWEYHFSERVTAVDPANMHDIVGQDDTDFVARTVGGGVDHFTFMERYGTTPKVRQGLLPGETAIPDSDVSGVVVRAIGGAYQDRDGNLSTASVNSLHLAHNWKVTVADATATEGADDTIDFEVSLNARDDCKTVTVDWATEDSTATAGEDYTAASGTLTFAPGETSKTISATVLDDTVADTGESFTLRLSNPTEVALDDAEATGTILDDGEPITARFENIPENHDGSTAFTFELHFSEEIPDLSYTTVADGLFEVTGANVTKASRTTKGSNRGWLVTAAPSGSGSADIAISLPVRACGETAAVCTADDRALSAALSATVPREVVTVSQTSGEELRLVGGATANEGRLEILLDGQWGTVCDDYWGKFDADVACRALGYEEGSVADATQFMRAHFGAGAQSVPIWLDNVECAGTETSLLACPRRYSPAVGAHNCRHREDVGVRCAGERSAPATVDTPAEPLTAAFRNVPVEHDGNSAFELELAFSEEPNDLSYKTVRDSLFEASGGRIESGRRVTQGSDLGFYVTVKPSGTGAVTLSLATLPACGQRGSVCTGNSRALEGPVGATVPGPAALSVADVEVEEAEGATLDFVVTLGRARTAQTTVDWATSDDTATAGADYTAASGTLTFIAGETLKTVSVTVLDDAHDEGSETMTLSLSNATGARISDASATGTITNSDPMPQAWITRLGRTVGSQVVDAVTARLDGESESHVTVGGMRLAGTGLPGTAPERWSESMNESERGELRRTISEREALLGSSFHLSTDGDDGQGPVFAAWGRVATGGFDADVDDVRMDGDVTTGMVGFDAQWDRMLAGLLLLRSGGEGSYMSSPAHGNDRGTVESTLTGVFPYARLKMSERVSAWGLAGVGSGELTLRHEGQAAIDTGLGMHTGAVGVKGTMLDGTGASGVGLNVKTDAMWVRTKSDHVVGLEGAESEASRLRFIIEGERMFEVGEDAVFTPTGRVGIRHDGGDSETGTGVEVGAGIRFTAGPMTIEGSVHALIAHEESGYREWGASGAIRVSPDASGRGLSLTLVPGWGRAASGTERLWSARDATAFAVGDDLEADGRLEAELGYGVGLARSAGVLTPYAGLSLGDNGHRTYQAGSRWRLSREATLSLVGTHHAGSPNRNPRNDLMLRAEIRF